MAIGGSILGGAILGGMMPMPQAAPATLTHSLYDGYILELADPDGDRIAVLTGAHNIRLDETINEPGSLDFAVPVNAWYSEQLTPPNIIRLYDRAGQLVQQFEIMEEVESWGTERTKTIACAGPMCLLNDDSIEYQNYIDDEDVPYSVAVTVAAILATQTNTRKVTLGGIEAALAGMTFAIKVEWETPLAALQRLRDVVGGFFWVDKDLKLWWRVTSTTNEPREIRWQKNLIGFQPSIDNDRVITHLRFFGREEGGERVSLPSPGYLVSSHYTPGDRQRWHTEVDQEIIFQDTLVKAAEVFLANNDRRRMRATVRILDLSQSPEYDFDDWYGVQLGDSVKVHHPSLGDEPVTLTAVSRSVDLGNPMDVSLELGEVALDLTYIVADLRVGYRRRQRDPGGTTGEIPGFETDPGVFAPPGTPDTADVGTSPNTIRADAVLPILPNLDTYTPSAITPGAGAPGIGPYAAPEDHVHPLDPADFETEGFVTDNNLIDKLTDLLTDPVDSGLETALENQILDLASDAEPNPVVSQDPGPGTAEEFARADHEHLGQPWIVALNKASLPTSGHADGVIAYTNGSGVESPWFLVNAAWIQPCVYLGSVSTLPAIPTAFAAQCRFAGQLWAAGPGDTYWTPLQRQTTYSGAPGTGYP